MIFVGVNAMSYQFLDIETGKTQYSIDCKFIEDNFYEGDLNFFNQHDQNSDYDSDDYSSVSSSSSEVVKDKTFHQHVEPERVSNLTVPYSQQNVGQEETDRYPTRDRKQTKRLTYFSKNDIEPKSYNTAINDSASDQWIQAMNDEHSSLIEYNTWTPVLKESQKTIGTRWVFKIKSNASKSCESNQMLPSHIKSNKN